ncbi:unnamed protein product [Aphanomyces euteiches]
MESPKASQHPFVEVLSLTQKSGSDESHVESKKHIASFTDFFHFADTTDYVLIFVGTIGAIASGVSLPLQMVFWGDVVNAFTAKIQDVPAFQHGVNFVVYQFLVVGAVTFLGGFAQVACFSVSAARQAKRLRHAYATAILHQDMTWFDLHAPTQLATRVVDTTLVVQEGMGRKLGDCISMVSMAVASFIIGFVFSWEISLATSVFTPFVALATFYSTKSIAAAVQGGTAAYAEAGGIAEEGLANVKTVQMFNSMNDITEKYNAALKTASTAAEKKGLAVGLGTGVVHLLTLATYAVAMYYGTVLVSRDQVGPEPCTRRHCYDGGRIITAFFAIAIGSMGVGQTGPSLQAIMTARATAAEMFDLIRRKPTIDASSSEGLRLEHVKGDIALDQVHFAYPSRPDVFVAAGYSLVIPAGQKVALVGGSGSGKSTVISLLERYYDPLSGRVTLDGHDLKSLNVHWLRSQFGLVGQVPCLFAGSIASNIRTGNPNATMDQVIDAAKRANAYNFIMEFPDGFDTFVGNRGVQLSGGQKQRLAIARAILKDPAVLLLDEATSALDADSEHIVQRSLDELVASRVRTTIIIAHRLSTIRGADRIVVLKDGQVVEDGSHETLMLIPNGQYKSMVDTNTSEPAALQSAIDVPQVQEMKSPKAKRQEIDETNPSESSESSESTPSRPDTSRLWRLSMPKLSNLILGSLGAIVHGAMFPLWGVFFAKCTVIFYSYNLGLDVMRSEAFKWAMGFLGLGVAALGASVVQYYQFAIVCERLTARLRGMSFRAMLHQEMSWFDHPNHAPGALTTRLASDAAAVRTLTAETLNAILMNAAALLVAFSVAFYSSWRVTLTLLAVIPIMGGAYMLQVKMFTSQANKSVNGGDVEAGALLTEAIGAIRTVVSFNMEEQIEVAYLKHLLESEKIDQRTGLVGGFVYSIIQSALLFAFAAIAYYCGWLILHEIDTVENIFLVFNPVLYCSFGLGKAVQGLGDATKAKAAVKALFDVIDRQPNISCQDLGGHVLGAVKGDLEFRQVAFHYPSRPQSKIYTNYNLKIQSGQTLALVGSSGSGKSTAIQLIERFYDPTAGTVFLDGIDLKTLNVQALRRQISIVGQEPVLFSGTIRDNIAMGKPGATDAEIEEAAKRAYAREFIQRFPDQYLTSVGSYGSQISGGQKQRIAIARAIIRDPAVLLLDEATSALDTESERIVQASLDALLESKRRTTIIVAHRLSTIRRADVIAVVDGGRITELGSHDELMAIPNGFYAKLVSRQL